MKNEGKGECVRMFGIRRMWTRWLCGVDEKPERGDSWHQIQITESGYGKTFGEDEDE